MRFDDFRRKGLMRLILISTLASVSYSSYAAIINIPSDLPDLSTSVDSASAGDTLLLAPGTYYENIVLSKDLTIASLFLTTGDTTYITSTVIDGGTNTVFRINPPVTQDCSIIGLTIRNGDDGIMATAPFNLLHNYITACDDGIDYETGGGGTCNYNTFRFNTDDGIDLDGTLYYIIIEGNIITDNDDDGIEIRLHDYNGAESWCRILDNTICRNGEDGIQLIDYPDTTNRTYLVERNLICDNDMAGIACMNNGVTVEDYRAAGIPEPIYVFNNTVSGHDHGLAGGGSLIAVNNIIINSETLGVKNTAGNSLIKNCLFYNNGQDFINSNLDGVSNIFSDPMIDDDFSPIEGSPCIDAGTPFLIVGSDTVLDMQADSYYGSAPDIGAIESTLTSSYIPEKPVAGFTAFPNPFRDMLEILSTESNPHHRLQIIDAKGTVLLNVEISVRSTRLDLTHYPPGVYYLRYLRNKEINTSQIIKI